MNTDAEKLIAELPKALTGWYDCKAGASALFVSGGRPECEVLADALAEKGMRVIRAPLERLDDADIPVSDIPELAGRTSFDYIVAAGIIERSGAPETLLRKLKSLLHRDTGTMLIGAENRLAIRAFCGDKDIFTGHVLDGIDGYEKINMQRRKVIGGRAYSKAELEKMLAGAGFSACKIYAVMPDLARPQMLLADGYVPNEPIDVRIFPQYRSPETIFLEEERLYQTLLENRMFHQMANGFLLECTAGGRLSEADQITVQGDRGHADAQATLLTAGKQVVKRALYPEGRQKTETLAENAAYLRRRGVPIVDGRLQAGDYVMPYVAGQMATVYFRETLQRSRADFIRELERFRALLLASSEHVPYEAVNWRQFEPWWEKRKKDDPNIDQWRRRAFGTEEERRNIGVILKRGYIDMVSINCFHTEAGFLFFDQEFYVENLPFNAVFIRTIDFIYRDSPELEQIWPRAEALTHFRLSAYQDTWRAMGNAFLETLRKEKELAGYHRLRRRDSRTVLANRYRMDYSQEMYDRLFTNIFKGVGSRRLYLFGAGNYTRAFIEQFGQYYEIAGVLDNNESRWGTTLEGIPVFSPAVLRDTDVPYKVFICIKYFEDVLAQLQDMGVRDIAIYDPRLDYDRPLRQASVPEAETEKRQPKPYHVGYVAGVFDLFHIGHLNLLRRAKERCDYLIVGVVPDEQVIRSKKTRPYIPSGERLAIVQACRYVDEAVMIPADKPNTEDAYHRYHFDAQFSGSDYANDSDWLARKVFLQQHGSDMVFLPYTETTSSTAIKEHLNGKEGSGK